MPDRDPELPLVFTRRDAVGAGLSESQASRRAAGRWERLRRGWFLDHDLEVESRWRAEIVAVVGAHRRRLVLSHAHAARAYGWPAPLSGWGMPSFTAVEGAGRRRADVWVTVADLDEREIARCGSVEITSPARTLADCARHLPPHDALALVDAALRRGQVTHALLRRTLDRQSGWRGVMQARAVVALGDGRRETTLESWSAWSFAQQGLAPTLWQATVLDADGVFIGRADAWWEQGVAGEADGRAKYRLIALERRGIVDARGLSGALDLERRRERDFARSGLPVVRWETGDLFAPARLRALAAHLHRQIALAARTASFTGRVIDV